MQSLKRHGIPNPAKMFFVKKGMSHVVKVCKYFSLLKEQIRAAANIKFENIWTRS